MASWDEVGQNLDIYRKPPPGQRPVPTPGPVVRPAPGFQTQQPAVRELNPDELPGAGKTPGSVKGPLTPLEQEFRTMYPNVMLPGRTQAEQRLAGQEVPSEGWNALAHAGNALTLGNADVLGSLGQTWWDRKEKVAANTAQGRAPPDFWGEYDQNKAKLQLAEEAWRKENPGHAMNIDLAGTTATTIGLQALGQRWALGPAAARLSSISPKMAGAVDYLLGRSPAFGSRMTAGLQQGAGGAVLQSGMNDKDSLADQMKLGALIGGVTNPVVGKIANTITSRIDPIAAESAANLKKHGVDVRVGQLPGGSPLSKTLESWWGGGKNDPQHEQFMRALSRQTGNESNVINFKWAQKAFKETGDRIDNVALQPGVGIMHADVPLTAVEIPSLKAAAARDLHTSEAIKVTNMLDEIEASVMAGTMQGPEYMGYTRHGGVLSNMIRSPDPNLRHFGSKIREALDDALERGTPPHLIADLRKARSDFRNVMIINDGIDSKVNASGQYNPRDLHNAVDKYSRRTYSGDTPMGELGIGGQFLYKPESVNPKRYGPIKVGVGLGAGGLGAGALYGAANDLTMMGVLGAVGGLANQPGAYTAPIIGAAAGAATSRGLHAWLSRPQHIQSVLAKGDKPRLGYDFLAPSVNYLYQNRSGQERPQEP